MLKIISCKEAKLQNLLKYFTGKPCKHGHISERKVNNRECLECVKTLRSEWSKNYFKQHYLDTIEKQKEQRRKHYQDNKDKYKEASLRQKKEGYNKKWLIDNRQYWNHLCALRRAAKKLRTPKWADKNKIKEIYLNSPEGFEVDHVVPLQGKLVSGLHVEGNLQYLTETENCKKNNSFEVS